VFETLGISPPFPQLDRPVYALAEHESGSELLRFADRSVGIDRLRAVLEHQRDWDQRVAYPRSEGWSRRFTRTQVTVFADSDNIAITRVRAVSTATGEPVRFATLDPITTSELLYDLETATTEPVAVNTETPIDRGTRVRIVRGADRGKHGVVFWLDEPPATRCGIRGDDGDTYWASLVMVVLEGVADPTDTEPWFDRGMRVRWTKAKQTGTGTVFWIGKNKFGDGMRVGIKDDASGETVWASAKDCAHEDAPRAD